MALVSSDCRVLVGHGQEGQPLFGPPHAPQQDPTVSLQRQGSREAVLKERAWEAQHGTLGSLPDPGQDESPLPNPVSPWSSLKT